MVSLPPDIWAELYVDGAWAPVSGHLRQTSPVTITRGLSSESASAAEPTACECVLDNRAGIYSPRNPRSPLRGKIGRNTPMRLGYEVGSPWAEFDGGLTYNSLFVNDNPALDITGDFDLRIDLALEDWAESQMLALRYVPTSSNESWALEILDGILTFIWSPNGLFASRITRQATEAVKGYHGQRMALRVTLDINTGSGYELRFYTGRTVTDTEWNLLGEPLTGTPATGVYAGSGYMEFGGGFAYNATPAGGSLNRMRGRAYALQLRDGIGGTIKVDMSTRSATPGGTTFVDSTGLTWSRGGDAVLTNRHVRMSGEVPAWPPTRDLSGNDTTVEITPSGVMRRMAAGNKPVDSALLRYIKTHQPVECWPLTDGEQSRVGQSLVGGKPMRQIIASSDTPAVFGKGTLADWIEPVIQILPDVTGAIQGECPVTAGTSAMWSLDFCVRGGGNESAGTFEIYDAGAQSDTDNQAQFRLIFDGNNDLLTLILDMVGESTSSSSLVMAGTPAAIYDEQPHHVRITMDPQASSTLWSVYADGRLIGSGTIPSIVIKAPRVVRFNWGFLSLTGQTMTERGLGYITLWDGTGPSAESVYSALMGFIGEPAGDRIERLAAEAGYVATAAGETSLQEPMGIQGRKTLLDLLNEANSTDMGYLLEARDRNELIHRGHSTLWNQPPAVVLDFSAGLISSPFRPVDDDKLTENDVSVRREYGAVPARQVLEEGELSVQDYPNGVGRYDNEYTYSLATDAQAGHVASMRLHLGTYNGVRYSRITLDLANPRVHQMLDDILRIDCGDKLRLTGLPEDHGPDDVDVLVQGYTEEAGPDAWRITFNCVPAEPWTALVLGSTAYGRLDTGGCVLAEDLTATETDVDVTTTGTRRWVDSATFPDEFPFDVRIGEEVMRVTACTGTTASQTFTVVRAVNGVALTHSAGADVRLATPVYLGL
ncbi:hypothetical protein ACH4F6_39025 [Streptomyces sp. NPDC017936]|uniref:hypothetical protein n=1 Tax=Streptomyces sp. NPDC017936 TaxID=3365016 RepID=UPI0037BB8766